MAEKRGVWGCVGIVGLLGVMLSAAPAVAQQAPQTIGREQSKVWIEPVPELDRPQAAYVYVGWNPAYSVERTVAVAVSQAGTYPRLQLNFYMLAPGFIWARDNALDEAYVKSWPYFRDKKVKVPAPHKGGGSGLITVRFEADDTNCFAFLVRQVAIGTQEGQSSNVSVDGFYCAARGVAVDDSTVSSVLSSIRATSDLAKPRVAFVRPAS